MAKKEGFIPPEARKKTEKSGFIPPEVKKKDVPQVPQMPSSTGGVVQEPNVTSAASLIGGVDPSQMTAPIQEDVVSQSSVGNVTSPTALPNQSDIELPQFTGVSQENIPVQGIKPEQQVTPKTQTYQQEIVETTAPTVDMGQIQASQQNALDQKTIIELDQDKDVFNDIMALVKQNYTPEQIAKGEYLDEAKNLFKEKAQYTDIQNLEEFSSRAGNYFDEQIKSPQRQLQKQFSDLEIRKTMESNPDLFDQSIMSPTEMDSEYGQILKDTYGEDVTVGDALFLDQNDFDTRNLMTGKYEELTGDYMGLEFVENARQLYLKDAATKAQGEILSQGGELFGTLGEVAADPQKAFEQANTYYRDFMAEKTKSFMSPFEQEFYDKINELETIISKNKGKDPSQADIKKIVTLQNEIKQFQASGENQIYDPITGQYHIKGSPSIGPEAGVWAQEVDNFKNQYANVGMSQMREDLDRAILEYDELKRIKDKYSQRGINTQFAPVQEEINEKLKQIQALTELTTFNYNPAKDYNSKPGLGGGFGRGAYKELTGKDYKGAYEDNLYKLEQLQKAGMPINDEIERYMTKSDMQELGESLGGSVVAGGKIGIELALLNKLKAFTGVPNLIKKISGGSKLKEKILTQAFDANMYGTSYKLAGESYATGVGEFVGEKLGRKLAKGIKLNPDGLASLAVEWGTGNVTEMGAELTGELVDRLASGENVDEALTGTLGLDTKEGLAGKLKDLALHTMILSGASVAPRMGGIVLKRIKYLRNKPEKTIEETEELEFLEENQDEKASNKMKQDALNDEQIVEEYNEIKDMPEEDLTAEQKAAKLNAEGIIEDTPVEVLAETKMGEQTEIQFPQDKLQEQRDKIAGVESVPIEVTELNARDYDFNPQEMNQKLDEVKGKGQILDENTSENISGLEIVSIGEESGRALAVVKYPNGEEVLFYKSSRGTDGKEQGGWYPIPGFFSERFGSYPQGYFAKDQGVLDMYGSETYKGTSDYLSANEETLGETKTKEDAVQKQSTEGVDVRQQPKDGETVVDENAKIEEPTKEGEEVQAKEEVIEPVTADVTNLKSEVDNVAEGMNPMAQKKVFDALTDYTEQVATETDLKGGKLIDEVANRIDQNEELNLTKDDILESKDELVDIIKQKQKQNERIRNQKIDDTQKKEGSKERVQLEEQRSEGKTDNGKTEGSKRQRIPSSEQEVIQETEEQLTSPPPAKETGEASVDVERIKKVGKTFADNIRKAKIPNELGNIKSSVGIDVAWNTAVEATARAVETGATIAQAVSNGVSKLKESDWYKSLSEEGKAQAESFVTNKLNEEYKNAEKKIVEETKEETPPPKPPKKESKKKEGSPRERRKQFLNRAKNDPTRDDATKRFLAEVDEMYEVESNKWANSDADRLMDLYEEQNALDQLIEDVKNGEDMSSSVQSMLAQKLVRKLESLERFEEAADMDLWIDEQGRKSGRFIQALSESSNPDSVKRAKTIEWKKQKDFAMQEKASNGIDTNEEIVNDSYKTSKSSVDNFKNNIDENSEVNKAIKNVSEGAVKKAKKKQSKARKNINKEKAYRNKLKEDFKKNRGNYLSMSATGLSSSGIEYAGNIAASYVRQGVYNVAEIINNVKEFFKEELEYELTDDDVKKVAGKIVQDEKIVKENLDIELRKIIKDHFNDRNKYGKELSQKFIDEAGLTNAEAKYLQDKVMESFEKAVKSEMENEVRRMFQRAKKNGTPKKVKTFTERVIDAYRFGALTNDKYSDQFGEYFGFVSLTNEDKVQMAKLAKAFESIPEGSLEQLKKMGEFTHYLNNLEKRGFKYKFYESLKYMHEMWYTSILSGLSTSYRGAKGILQTGVSDLFVEALKNPRLFFSVNGFIGGIKQLNYGLDKGKTAFLEILRTGYNPMDKAQELEISPTKLNDLINNKQKGWKAVEKAFYYLPAKMVRILVASDALVKMTTKDLFAYTKTYNNLLNEGGNRRTKKFWSDLADRMHNSQAEFDIAMETAKGEKKAMEEAGVNTKGFNLRNRANEIIEERRDISAREYSTYKAEKAGLNQTPQGLIGVLYKKIVEASQTVPLIQLVVPFTKIPSNQVSLWLDWSPWGFKRAAFGYGTGVRKSKIAKKYGEKEVEAMRLGVSSMSADERVELMIKAVLGTAAWGALFWQLGLDDDDEYKMIDASYNGFGDFKKNEGLRKNNWRPYSVRFRLPGGEWSDYIEYRDSPLGFVFASISSVSDQLKYQKEDEGSLTKKDTEILIYGGMLNSLMFVKEQNYMKGISDFMDVFNVNYGSDAEGVLKQLGSKGAKFLYDTPTQYFKSILYPNIYKQVYGTYKAYSGKPQNIKARFGEDTPLYMWQSLLSDIPYLEDLESANLGQMFDDLGNPIVRRVRDTAPWISLIWSEDYVDMQRQSGEYDNYKMLNSKGLSAGGIYIPRSINGVKDIDPLDKVKVSKKQAELMNEFITKHFDKIKGMSKIEAQEFISKGYEKNKKRSRKVIKDKYK